MYLGDRLKQAREAANLNQSQLARMAGLTPSAISQIESGLSKKPSAENLLPLARALGVNPEWLVTGKGDRHTLSAVQARIRDVMTRANMQPFDLADATGGRIAPETIEMWLSGTAEPNDMEIETIAEPLGKSANWIQTGTHAAHENNIHVVYDTRGDPVPENLSQTEIDIIRDFRCMDDSDRKALKRMIHVMAETARIKHQKKVDCG